MVYDANGASVDTNSFVMGDIGVGGYTATFADNADVFGNSYDKVDNLTIDFSGATLTQLNFGTLVVANSISLLAGTLDLGDTGQIQFEPGASGSFVIDGLLEGSGTIHDLSPALTGTGTILALAEPTGTALDLGSAVNTGLVLQVGTGATMEVTTVQTGVTITVEDGGSGAVQLDDLGNFHGAIAGLAVGHGANANPGSELVLTNIGTVSGDTARLTSAQIQNNVITLQWGTQTLGTIDLVGADYNGDFVNWVQGPGLSTEAFITDAPVCYVAGTAILTPAGDVAVETIAAGDQVIAVIDGERVARSVKWVGHRTLVLDHYRNAAELAPIRIRRGALGEGMPARDLLVSPSHCMYLDSKLIPAKLLVNGMTIVRDDWIKAPSYHHIQLEQHALLIAEGVEAEFLPRRRQPRLLCQCREPDRSPPGLRDRRGRTALAV